MYNDSTPCCVNENTQNVKISDKIHRIFDITLDILDNTDCLKRNLFGMDSCKIDKVNPCNMEEELNAIFDSLALLREQVLMIKEKMF